MGHPAPEDLASELRIQDPAVALYREHGDGPLLLVCEHASASIPARYADLGLSVAERTAHIGWDPGALALAQALADRLESPLVHARHSRLLMDLNRDPAAPDAIVSTSDGIRIPGNQALDEAERSLRRRWLYEPFHAAIEALAAARAERGRLSVLVSIHSFTPVLQGHARPWQIGVLSDRDRRLADALLADLRRDPALTVGDNQPYAPSDGVYHSMDRHGQRQGRPCVMLEIRNDQLIAPAGPAHWAERLAQAFERALGRV